MTTEDVLAAAKRLAQFPAAGGVNPITDDPGDGNQAIRLAVDRFSQDQPLESVTDYTVASTTFRVTLFGTGAVLTGTAAWVEGRSSIVDLFYPWLDTTQNPAPLDDNDTVIERGAGGKVILAFKEFTLEVGQVLRLVTSGPHAADLSTIPAGYGAAFEALTAYFLLTLAANKAAQNTGNTGFATDVVDRRSQAGEFYLRAKNMLEIYRQAMGQVTADGPGIALSGVKDLDVGTSHPVGMLWHPKSNR